MARKRPVQLLMLGGPRTGTAALYAALEELGLRTYHSISIFKDISVSLREDMLWVEAMRLRFLGEGKPWEREEFDKLLGDYDAIGDIPLSIFADDLVKAYPDAKVILTNRDADSWYKSMSNTLFSQFNSPKAHFLAMLDPMIWGPLMACMPFAITLLCGQDWSDEPTAKGRFLKHYEHVREIVPSEKILELHPPFRWEPLCEFLGIKKGDERWREGEFGRVNDTRHSAKLFDTLKNDAIKRILLRCLKKVLPAMLFVIGLAAWWHIWLQH